MKFYVDGIPLQDPDRRWDVMATSFVTPGLTARSSNIVIPGRPGVLWTGQPVFDAPQHTIVIGAHGATEQDMMLNSSAVLSLLRNGSVLRRVNDDLDLHVGYELVSTTEPTYLNISRKLYTTCVLRFNDVYWREDATVWTSQASPTGNQLITTLSNMTAPVIDPLIIVKGPIVNPKVTCGDTWIQVATTVTANQYLLIDPANFTAYLKTSLAWDSTGTDRSGQVSTSGGPVGLVLMPKIAGGDPRNTNVTISVSGGAQLYVQAGRAFLA